MTRVALTSWARAGWGTFLLVSPGTAPHPVGDTPAGRRTVRVLGARHLLQACWVTARPDRRRALIGAGIDVAHAASMVALALLAPQLRRVALLDAAIAAGWAGTATEPNRSAGHGPAREAAA